MQRHSGVEVRLGSLHLYGNGDDLNQFGRVRSNDMATHDAVAPRVNHQFHQHPRLAAGQRRLQRAERRLVDINDSELRPRLRLGEAHGADLGLREHGGRNIDVIDLDRPLAENRIGESVALTDRYRRQIEAMGDVADRIDMWPSPREVARFES